MAQTSFGRRILVVDDDRGLRHVLSELLQEAGHTLATAGDGPEALEMLGNGSGFDLVLLDVGLPSMSGLDVLARIRNMESPPLVIVMTADDTSATLLEAVRRQAYRYIRKPFPPSTIVDVVSEAAKAVDGVAKFNAWSSSISTGGFATVSPGGSDASNTIAVDPAEWALTPALGLMVVTLDNANGESQAQLIPVKLKNESRQQAAVEGPAFSPARILIGPGVKLAK
jgi:CheY-like chemotaxis protein